MSSLYATRGVRRYRVRVDVERREARRRAERIAQTTAAARRRAGAAKRAANRAQRVAAEARGETLAPPCPGCGAPKAYPNYCPHCGWFREEPTTEEDKE